MEILYESLQSGIAVSPHCLSASIRPSRLTVHDASAYLWGGGRLLARQCCVREHMDPLLLSPPVLRRLQCPAAGCFFSHSPSLHVLGGCPMASSVVWAWGMWCGVGAGNSCSQPLVGSVSSFREHRVGSKLCVPGHIPPHTPWQSGWHVFPAPLLTARM